MIRQLSFYLRLFLFWMLVFFIQRIVFLLLNTEQLGSCSVSLLVKTLVFGEIMDISVTSYILFLIILIFFLTLPGRRTFFFTTSKIVVYILIVVTCLLTICDAALQHYWGTRMNEKALSVLLFPRMAFDAAKSSNYILLLAVMVLMASFFIYLYRFFSPEENKGKEIPSKKYTCLLSLFLIPFLVIGARGGVQKYPLGKSTVFFSDNFTCNYAAVNPLWNFINILINIPENSSNMYQYYPEDLVKKEFENLFSKKDMSEVPRIFSVDKPNIVMILLESFSAGNLPKLNGKPVALKLNSLLDSSLWFTNFYANGFRSEHALVALLSGIPPLPGLSMLRESNRVVRLPFLTKLLKDSLGYSLQFYNTYDMQYARMNEYLTISGFEKIVTDNSFKDCRQHQWGAYDEYLFDFVLRDLQTNKTPFFSLVLTSVSHEPFQADVRKVFPGNTELERYKNTVYYTDSCLSAFLESARLKSWYKNTVFIILADHGHAYPDNRDYFDPLKFNIPFLIFGEPLKKEFTGKSIFHPASQMDFPATILHQLGMRSTPFPLSRDMISEDQPHFAFFTFSDGFGYVSEDNMYAYNKDVDGLVFAFPGDKYDSMDILRGKIIIQWLSGEFKNLN